MSAEIQNKLLVTDKKIASEIQKKIGLHCEVSDRVLEVTRCLRSFMQDILKDQGVGEMKNMALGLAHGLGRFRIKFSADKVDTMIMQAISLHEDLDKEINNYMMRLKEWYGYHFPELSKIIEDSIDYVKVAKALGNRKNGGARELASIVGEEFEQKIRTACDLSIGTEISEQDE